MSYIPGDTVVQENNTRLVLDYDHDSELALNMIYDNDGQVPFAMLPWNNKQRTDLYKDIEPHDAERLQRVFIELNQDVELFERWIRIVYGDSITVIESIGDSQGDIAYIALWPSAEWLDTVGLESPYNVTESDYSEVEAYLWGRTYMFRVERYDAEYNEWYEIATADYIVGEIQDCHLEERAQESLDAYLKH